MFEDDDSEDLVLYDLIYNEAVIYKKLVDVEQDGSYLTLGEFPNGLMSDGFSCCYAVIIKNTAEPSKGIALAHVSSIGEQNNDIDFYAEMIKSIRTDACNVTIELARSKQSYEEQYRIERLMTGHDHELPPTREYFEHSDKLFLQFFKKNFPQCTLNPIIHEMPHGMIVIDALGEIQLLDKYPLNSLQRRESPCVPSEETNDEPIDGRGYEADDESSSNTHHLGFFKRRLDDLSTQEVAKRLKIDNTQIYRI